MLSAFKNYFAITKKEWNGMLVLAVLILMVLIAPDVYQQLKKPDPVDFTRIKEAQHILDLAAAEKPEYYRKEYPDKYSAHASFSKVKSKPVYFLFNPNNLDAASWMKLGLSERQIKVIKNYEAKGGKFYKNEDLQKIYSVTPEDYARLLPYISIPEITRNNFYKNGTTFKPKSVMIVEVNQADSAQLTTIKGIGPAFASRILKYRNRLGGFYRKTQLMEVYGLDSAKYAEVANQMTIDVAGIIKININEVDFEDLKRNPYLNYKQINAIIQYRKQHGKFNNIKDLKNVVILNEEIINKLEPYFTY
ncbi:MAG: hypothetical protein EOP43_01555 [Sphingobacteriaceae bacterium]|nr:MAG: hypothetical protein EOP43_01555 [Sphingobacteriaceae bacterium]